MSEYFDNSMKNILGARYADFAWAIENKPRHKALRVNTGKISVEAFLSLVEKQERSGLREYRLKPNPLCAQSFYTCVKPSLDPLYHAGLYYMQEPSAASAVFALSPFIGTRVLDLCSAPGGKGTQAAAFMRGGVIFMNDVELKRVSALKENVQRLGVKNAVITHNTASDFSRAGFDFYFDTLIIDAPCSGGGMLRYETVPYTEEIVAGCALRQREILLDALKLLRRGGYLLYSTCTFSEEENERNAEFIIENGFEPVETPLLIGAERGIGLPQARRIYPHNFDGEGHFYCVFKKTSGEARELEAARYNKTSVRIGGLTLDCAEYRGAPALMPDDIPKNAESLRVVARGVEVFERNEKEKARGGGRDKRSSRGSAGESIPSYAITHALDSRELTAVGAADTDENDAARYIRGEQLRSSAPLGYAIVTHEGYALGLARAARTSSGEEIALKNLYPKRLRV